MAVEDSGRIVSDVDPEVKRRLYSALALSKSALKDWFLKNAVSFCEETQLPNRFFKERDQWQIHGGKPAIPERYPAVIKKIAS
jgi:hypothetical protein